MPLAAAMPSFPHSAAMAIPLAGACSWLLLPAMIPQLRSRLLHQPNARSSHRHTTPHGGGVAFVLVALIVVDSALHHFAAYISAPFLMGFSFSRKSVGRQLASVDGAGLPGG